MSNADNRQVICYITGTFPSRTETFIRNEIELLKCRYRVIVLASKGDAGMDVDQDITVIYLSAIFSAKMLKSHFMTFFSIPRSYIHSLSLAFDVLGIREGIKVFYKIIFFYRCLKYGEISHIHAHFANRPTEIAMILSNLLGIKFSFSAHANDIYTAGECLPAKINKAEFVSICHRSGWEHLCKLAPEMKSKIHLVYHGVDTERWKYSSTEYMAEEPVILGIGRFVEKKGFEFLIKALGKLKDEFPKLKCVLVGDGPLKKGLKKLVRERGMHEMVVFEGWKTPDEIRDLLTSATVLVQPSIEASNGDKDGIPNVILEAMASGVPVVSTPVSGIPEILHNDNSVLVNPYNEHALADGIAILLRDGELREKLKANARITASRFNAGDCIKPLFSLFEQMSGLYRNCQNHGT